MRKLLIILMMVCVSLIQPNLQTVSASTEGIEINEFVADITLLDTGDMVVREEWHMVYDEAFRVRFRDIGFHKFPDDYPLSYADTNRAYFNETEFYMIMFKDNVDITSSVRFATSLELERDELGEYIKCVPYSIYCESLFVDTGFRGGLQGDIVFVYSYRIDGAVSVYSCLLYTSDAADE